MLQMRSCKSKDLCETQGLLRIKTTSLCILYIAQPKRILGVHIFSMSVHQLSVSEKFYNSENTWNFLIILPKQMNTDKIYPLGLQKSMSFCTASEKLRLSGNKVIPEGVE